MTNERVPGVHWYEVHQIGDLGPVRLHLRRVDSYWDGDARNMRGPFAEVLSADCPATGRPLFNDIDEAVIQAICVEIERAHRESGIADIAGAIAATRPAVAS